MDRRLVPEVEGVAEEERILRERVGHRPLEQEQSAPQVVARCRMDRRLVRDLEEVLGLEEEGVIREQVRGQEDWRG